MKARDDREIYLTYPKEKKIKQPTCQFKILYSVKISSNPQVK